MKRIYTLVRKLYKLFISSKQRNMVPYKKEIADASEATIKMFLERTDDVKKDFAEKSRLIASFIPLKSGA